MTDSNQIFMVESYVLLKAFADVISSLAPGRIRESGSSPSLLILLLPSSGGDGITMKSRSQRSQRSVGFGPHLTFTKSDLEQRFLRSHGRCWSMLWMFSAGP